MAPPTLSRATHSKKIFVVEGKSAFIKTTLYQLYKQCRLVVSGSTIGTHTSKNKYHYGSKKKLKLEGRNARTPTSL